MVGDCGVCGDTLPSVMLDQHHEVPQAAGGRDGATVQLCPRCHQTLHRIATMLMGKRASQVDDTLRIAYPDGAVRRRIYALALTVVEHMTAKRDGRVAMSEPQRVMIELEPEIKIAASMMARECRGSTGRPMGLASWIARVITNKVVERNPQVGEMVRARMTKHARRLY